MRHFLLSLILLLAPLCESRAQMNQAIVSGSAVVASTAWLTASGGGTPRNNQDGCIGGYFTVGGASITVTDLGRWVISGNSASHTLYLTDASGNRLGSVAVNTSGASVGFLYGSITPVVLSASTKYRILSTEVNGGDNFYDFGAYTTTAVAALGGGNYDGSAVDCAANPIPGISEVAVAGDMYVPIDFKYH